MLFAIIKDGITSCSSAVLKGFTRLRAFMYKFIVRCAGAWRDGVCKRRTGRSHEQGPLEVREHFQQELAAAVSQEIDSEAEARSSLSASSTFSCYNRVRNRTRSFLD